MAKKTAQKKKSVPVKSKSAKASKAPKLASKVVKTGKISEKTKKSAAPTKPVKPVKPIKVKAVKPALMTKIGKKATSADSEVEVEATKKSQTIVSMIESDSNSAEPAKVEKVSKAKPIKIERGNVTDERAKWAELNKKFGKEKAMSYKMTESFPSLAPLQHKVLGWGYILTNENDRLEVLFENGIRMLISNYKS